MEWSGHYHDITLSIGRANRSIYENNNNITRMITPKMTWKELAKNDKAKLGMDSTDSLNCSLWRGDFKGDKSLG